MIKLETGTTIFALIRQKDGTSQTDSVFSNDQMTINTFQKLIQNYLQRSIDNEKNNMKEIKIICNHQVLVNRSHNLIQHSSQWLSNIERNKQEGMEWSKMNWLGDSDKKSRGSTSLLEMVSW